MSAGALAVTCALRDNLAMPEDMEGFSLHHHDRARTARYHRGFWVSNELSSVRAATANLCSHFFEPSNQSQTTKSPSTAVTVIAGPPELRRTVSPGLKGMFDIQTLPSHGIGCAVCPPRAMAPPLNSEDTSTPRWQLAVKLHHFATSVEGPVLGERQGGQKSIVALYQVEAERPER
jgi:hypothetical protein